jgi:hypothetical protein
LGWAEAIYIPHSSAGDGGTQFLGAMHLSAQPFSISKVSFLPVTLVLQPLILECSESKNPLAHQWIPLWQLEF